MSVLFFRFPYVNSAEDMLEEIYMNQNRNRTKPCVQGRNDTYRIFQYDINTAAEGSHHTTPLLLTRHNVVPGMILVSPIMNEINRYKFNNSVENLALFISCRCF